MNKDYRKAISMTSSEYYPTLTTRYGALSYKNIVKHSRYPMPAILYEFK